eukprot:SAG11_NODE_340_length_10476_cov_6.009155_7_plen_126_part_00
MLEYSRQPRGLSFLELCHLYSSLNPRCDGSARSREYVGMSRQEEAHGKRKTGLDTKYGLAFRLYDFDVRSQLHFSFVEPATKSQSFDAHLRLPPARHWNTRRAGRRCAQAPGSAQDYLLHPCLAV